MPQDQKRINPPDDTVPYELFTRKTGDVQAQKFRDILKAGKRADGRAFKQFRPIYMNPNVIEGARGSLYLEQGSSVVIASIFEPREIPNQPDYNVDGELVCEFKFATFSCPKRRLHQQDDEEKHFGAIIRKSLENVVNLPEIPNVQVEINVLVLHNDGGCLSAAIMCAGVCLCLAGLPVYGIPVPVTIGIQDDVMMVDPTLSEQVLCSDAVWNDCEHGVIMASILHPHKQISQYYQTGSLSLSKLQEALDVIEECSGKLLPLLQKIVRNNLLETLKKNSENNREM